MIKHIIYAKNNNLTHLYLIVDKRSKYFEKSNGNNYFKTYFEATLTFSLLDFS